MLATQQTITPPVTPPDRRIYAIGDVHGRFDLLKKLLEMIQEDGASNWDTLGTSNYGANPDNYLK